MNEVNHAVLDSLREFFNRVDSSSVRPIGVKDFIGWCNEPCDYYPKSSKSDSAYKLGKTICALEELSDDKIDGIKEVLEAVTISVIGDINVPSKEQKGKLFDKARSDLLKYDEIRSELEKHLGVYHGELSKTSKKDLPENVAFYCALKSRLKSCPDEQGYYHYQFDDNGNTIARVDPLKPFVDSTHDNLNQQWHVLISVLAYLDVAHALSNDHHECHYLYPYLSSYDKGNLNKMRLKLKSTLSLEATPEIGKPINYPSEAMVAWIKDTLVRREGKQKDRVIHHLTARP